MTDSIKPMEFQFPSWDGESSIHAMLWRPEGDPRGVVQLIHGMSEHIERYEPFARFLAGNGFIVVGHDHIGHGHSVSNRKLLGHMPTETGADVLVEDVNTLRYIAASAFPDLPYFIFGHSMGSFVLRVYLTRHGQGLSGAILCGTGNKPHIASLAGNALAQLGSKVRGETAKSDLIHSMADGAFSNAIDNPRTNFDWISANRSNVDAYMDDDLNGFQFTLGGYASLTKLTLLAASLEHAKKIRQRTAAAVHRGREGPGGRQRQGREGRGRPHAPRRRPRRRRHHLRRHAPRDPEREGRPARVRRRARLESRPSSRTKLRVRVSCTPTPPCVSRDRTLAYSKSLRGVAAFGLGVKSEDST